MTEPRPSVLILDDSPEDTEVFQRALREDFQVLTAATGAQGRALIAAQPPDCVLLDYQLPDLTGLEFLTEWDPTQVDAYAVIVLTGHADVALAVECMKHGAHDFLTKGRFHAQDLRRAVTHGIERVSLRRQLATQQRALEAERAHLEERVATRTAALQASEAKARAILDASPVPFALAHETGTTRYVNPAFTQTFGYRREDIPTWTDWRLKAMPDPVYRAQMLALHQERLARVQREGGVFEPLEVMIRCKDGAPRTVMVRATPLGGEECLNTVYDITELKQAREVAEQAARNKSDFLAHMSHEIRTPMNGILGLVEITLHRTLSPEVRADLVQVHESATALLDILNDVLDQSKLEAGRLTLERRVLDIEQSRATLHSFFYRVATAKGLDFRVEVAPSVPRYLLGDALRLQQVLSNLVGNALKFTDRGAVQVGLRCEGPVGAQANLIWTVADTGIGMDAATLDCLFQPFTQGDASIARRFGGTGLGLNISHHLAALMGGTLTVASNPGAGTTFTLRVRLGVAAAPTTVAESTPGPAPDVTGARILVAEDQPLNQRVIGDLLRLLGAEVVCVDHGGAALERLAAGTFDAVLMDIQMPTMDGLTATRHIRENPAWATLPVIALTAGVTPPERVRMHAVGISDLLAKPVTLDALRITLARWLDRPAACAPPTGVEASGAVPAPNDTPVIPGFDFRGFEPHTGETNRLRHYLRQFAESSRDDAALITAALAAGDLSAARARVHRLKGAAGQVGATALGARAQTLEETLQANADPTTALAAFCQAHDAALAGIAALAAPAPLITAPPAGPLPAAARPLVTEVQARLVQGLLPPRHLLAALEAALPTADRGLVDTLRHHLDRIDLSAARRLLDPLVAATPTPPPES